MVHAELRALAVEIRVFAPGGRHGDAYEIYLVGLDRGDGLIELRGLRNRSGWPLTREQIRAIDHALAEAGYTERIYERRTQSGQRRNWVRRELTAEMGD